MDWRQHLRDRLFGHQKGRCFYCRCRMVAAGADDDRAVTLDEVVPRSAGGRARFDNAVAACRKCNQAKGDQDIRAFLKKARPGRPLSRRVFPPKDHDIAAARAARKARERRRLTTA